MNNSSNHYYSIYSIEEIMQLPIKQENNNLIEDVLPSGLTVFAAGPKDGKSVLSTQLAIDVALGKPFLGKYPTNKTKCLYISLEETPLDTNARLSKHSQLPSPEELFFADYWAPASEGGIPLLDMWLEDHPEHKLVIIDILARFRWGDNASGSSYGGDYRDIGKLKKLCEKHSVSMILLHHTVKLQYKDWVANLYGSMGIAGVSDTTWYLDRRRGSDDATLKIASRKVQDLSINLTYDRNNLQWLLAPNQNSNDLTPEREELLLLLGQENGPMRLSKIATATKKSLPNSCKLLKHLINSGYIETVKKGIYRLTTKGKKFYQSVVE